MAVTTYLFVFQAISRLIDQSACLKARSTMESGEDAEDDEASTAERRYVGGRGLHSDLRCNGSP